LFDISKAQRIGAVVMSLNRYQQLLTSLLTSVTQIDTIFFIILNKDKHYFGTIQKNTKYSYFIPFFLSHSYFSSYTTHTFLDPIRTFLF